MSRHPQEHMTPRERALYEADIAKNQPGAVRRVGVGALDTNNQPVADECGPRRPPAEDDGYEVVQTDLWTRPTGRVQIVALGIDLKSSAPSAGYVWVWDGVFDMSSTLPDSPDLNPIIVAPGMFVGWEASTRWDRFERGITIGVSTSDTAFVSLGAAFGVYWHLMRGGS